METGRIVKETRMVLVHSWGKRTNGGTNPRKKGRKMNIVLHGKEEFRDRNENKWKGDQ